MKRIILATCFCLFSALTAAGRTFRVFIADEIKAEGGQPLVLNGVGLREKFWVDVYVGSLYLPVKSDDVAEILSKPRVPGGCSSILSTRKLPGEKLLDAWREGLKKSKR